MANGSEYELRLKAVLDTADVQQKLQQLRGGQGAQGGNGGAQAGSGGASFSNLGGLSQTMAKLNQGMAALRQSIDRLSGRVFSGPQPSRPIGGGLAYFQQARPPTPRGMEEALGQQLIFQRLKQNSIERSNPALFSEDLIRESLKEKYQAKTINSYLTGYRKIIESVSGQFIQPNGKLQSAPPPS